MVLNDELEGVLPLSISEFDLRTKVLAAMPENTEMTADEIAARAGIERAAVLKALRYLVDCETVIRVDGKYRRLSRDARG